MADQLGDRLAALEAAVDAVLHGFDVGLVPASSCPALVARVARVRHRLGVVEADLAGRVAQTDLWRRSGAKSAGEWFARVAGSSTGEAAQRLATAQRLGDLPETRRAVEQGDLSPAQAAVIVDAAALAPAAEGALVEVARRESLKGLRDEAGRAKAASDRDAEARHARLHRRRGLRTWTDPDGAFKLMLSSTPEAGAELMARIRPFREQAFRQARAEGRRESPEAYDADGLLALARAAGSTGGQPGPGRSGSLGKVIVRVDVGALARGRVGAGEVCEVVPGSPVPVSQAQRFIDEGAFVAAVLTRGEQVLGVAHFGRKPTAKQRTALEWLSPRCSVAGCDQAVRLEVDHRIDWVLTHHTMLGELDSFCDGHHDLKTTAGWQLVAGHGRRRFVPPGDPAHPGRASPAHGHPAPAPGDRDGDGDGDGGAGGDADGDADRDGPNSSGAGRRARAPAA